MQRALAADERGQAVGAAAAGDDGQARLRQAELGGRGCDAEGRGEGELEAAAEGGAVDGGDGGDRERGELREGCAEVAEEFAGSVFLERR